jgi:hypothetical protein
MRSILAALLFMLSCVLFTTPPARAEQGDFQPDPLSVQRYGPAYRYPQAGWIVLHIEGKPYERGYQHGRLMASEIAAHLRCYATVQSPKAPAEAWRITRTLANALFVRRFDREYLEEMKGIADGATAAGARFDSRPIDVVDIVALNCWPEIETLPGGLEALPTGLEGVRFPQQQVQAMPAPKPMHCSAFAATGPATADGKIVFGHITMFSLYPSHFYNVWLDVKPAAGHRVLMQSYPGGMQSGMDYYLNDAGLIVCETTIHQTRYNMQGQALASRIRKALQYADSIDRAVEILREANNGLYTNEWLLADIKTNEIAMFELGTAKSKLYRSSKGEWFGGTEGFYWGCNNMKDLDVRLETIPSVKDRPANVVWRPSDRDKVWLRLYAKHKGHIDAGFGKEAFTTPPLAAHSSLDAKFTTTNLAGDLKTWALFGPPLGLAWQPTRDEREHFPELRPLVSNPWTILHGLRPSRAGESKQVVADLSERLERRERRAEDEDRRPPTKPAWHGTLLPRTDADTWLAAAFADYEHIVSLENALRDRAADGNLSAADRDRLALELYAARANYLAGARAGQDTPLSRTQAAVSQDDWYRVAAGKGVWVLHELRRYLKPATFDHLMDRFGAEHAGRETSVADLQDFLRKAAPTAKTDAFFAYWLDRKGLPTLHLIEPRCESKTADGKSEYVVTGKLRRDPGSPPCVVEVTVETGDKEVSRQIALEGSEVPFQIPTHQAVPPRRVIVDKYGTTAKTQGGVFNVASFNPELDHALIVYGTADEAASQREAAEALQRTLRERSSNYTVPVRSDQDVTEDELRSHHLVLIGRPDSNRLVERFRQAVPVRFGKRSFQVAGETYAHPASAVVVAGENPANRRYSLVVVAGLSAEATFRVAPEFLHAGRAAEVMVLANGASTRALVLPPADLVHEFAGR